MMTERLKEIFLLVAERELGDADYVTLGRHAFDVLRGIEGAKVRTYVYPPEPEWPYPTAIDVAGVTVDGVRLTALAKRRRATPEEIARLDRGNDCAEVG